MGSFSLFISRDFWTAKIGLMPRLCYLSGMLYYSATAIGIFVTPIPGIYLVWFQPELVHWYNLIFSIPSLVYGTLALALWSRAPWGFYAVTTRAVSYWAYFFGLVDKLRGDLMPWVPTGATGGITTRYKVFLGSFIAWNLGVYGLQMAGSLRHYSDYNFYPMMALSTFHFLVFLVTILRRDH